MPYTTVMVISLTKYFIKDIPIKICQLKKFVEGQLREGGKGEICSRPQVCGGPQSTIGTKNNDKTDAVFGE